MEELLGWACEHALPSGVLAEQVNPGYRCASLREPLDVEPRRVHHRRPRVRRGQAQTRGGDSCGLNVPELGFETVCVVHNSVCWVNGPHQQH